MENPFVLGTPVSGENFTGRDAELSFLTACFKDGQNTVIIAPGRSGKTSLVQSAIGHFRSLHPQITVIYINASLCRTESDFLKLLGVEIIRQSYTRLEEWAGKGRRFLSDLSPEISFGPDPDSGFTLSFESEDIKLLRREITSLPSKVHEDTQKPMIICIDDFHQLIDFPKSLQFLKMLRHEWQKQQNVTLSLCGNGRQDFRRLFTVHNMPFYRFGELIFPEKIEVKDWISFICGRFERSGKLIPPEIAKQICLTVDCHACYVQMLSWLVWNKTGKIAGQREFMSAMDDLISMNSAWFLRITGTLTRYHLQFLRALSDGLVREFTSAVNMKKYGLSSSANVARIKQALDQKEIIDIDRRKITFSDPVFRLWLRKQLK